MASSRSKLSENTYIKKPIHHCKEGLHGGTIINLVFALIVLGLIGWGVWWIIKSFGQAGQQYTQTMVDTKFTAETVKCQTNLRAIAQNIQIYALSNEGFPPSLEDLVKWSGSTKLFKCPSADGGEYIYIPGQNSGMPTSNVLVYESKPVHDGRCNVLRLGGQIELLTAEELKRSVAQTYASMR
jgi:hypothetical protein